MKKNFILIFLILFNFLVSLFVFNLKGYFNISKIRVEARGDIQNYLNTNYIENSFIFTSPTVIKNSIYSNFNDVDNVKLKREFDLSYTVFVSNKEAFGKIDNKMYLSKSGEVFYSNTIESIDLPRVYIKNYKKNTKYLTKDQISFISKLYNYPNVQIHILDTNRFEVTADTYVVEVPSNFKNVDSMVTYANYQIKNNKEPFIKLIVLKDKIVLKN